jgi:hypothetical protein
MPLSAINCQDDDLRTLARALCEAAFQDPDRMVFSEVSSKITTPRGIAHSFSMPAVPLWTLYLEQARNLKRITSKS